MDPPPTDPITTAPDPSLTAPSPSQSHHHPEPNHESPPLQQQPQFTTPLFTLIHDPSTNFTTHPRSTHYIFSDDDSSSILTSACVRAQDPSCSNERIIIIDMDSTGKSVQHTASLSPEWQVLKAGIQDAPTLRGREGDGEGMMLRIEGVGVGRANVGKKGDVEGEEMRGLMEDYEGRMEVLRTVVGEKGGGDGE